MAQEMQYMTEEELGTGRPSNERLGIELAVVASLCFLALRFGGFHKGGNPLGEVVTMNDFSAIVIASAIAILYLGARLWRLQRSQEEHSGAIK